MKLRRIMLVILVLCLSIGALVLSASAANESGGFKYVVSNGTASIVEYVGNDKHVVVPAKLDGYPVKEVQFHAFFENDTMESVVISEGIEHLCMGGDTSFFRCTALKSISLPASLVVTAPELTDMVISGDFGLFIESPKVEAVNVASGNPYIKSVDGVVFNKKMTSILCYPSGKRGESYKVPDTVTFVVDSSFAYQQYLEEVTLPDGVKRIGHWAFNNAQKLEKVNIPKSCEIIGQFAFQSTQLKTLHIPAKLQALMDSALIGAPIEKITLDTANPYFVLIDGVLYGKMNNAGALYVAAFPVGAGRTSYVMPDGVVGMQDHVFDDARELKEVTLCEGLEYISPRAFFDCENLRRIVIPTSVKEIGDYVFANAWALNEIYYKGTKTQWNKIDIDENANIDGLIHYGVTKPASHSKIKKVVDPTENANGYTLRTCECGHTYKTDPVFRAWVYKEGEDQIITAAEGKTAKITLRATGEGLTYTWYYKNAGSSQFAVTKTFTGNTYSLTMDASKAGRQVYCVVKDKYGFTDQSDTYILELSGPKITTQPKTTYTKDGATAKTTVKATGDALKYQWYVKNAGASSYTKSSNKTATYQVTMSDKVKDRYAYCVITDAEGNSVKTNTVRLRMAATITTQPKTVSGKLGDTVKTTVKAKGDSLTYTWYIKNEGKTSFSKSSVKTATYSCTVSDTSDNRQVYCVVKDKYGKTHKSNVVTIQEKVKITTQPKTTYTKSGATAKVTVKAKGDGLKYTWYVRNAGSDTYSKSSITSSTYSVKMSSKVKDRRVYCVIKDAYGNKVQTKTVILRMAASVITQPKSVTVSKGSIAKVTVKAAGDGLKYTWYYKNPGATKFTKTTTFTGNTYSMEMTKARAGRQVYCKITDKYGNTVKTNTVSLKMK